VIDSLLSMLVPTHIDRSTRTCCQTPLSVLTNSSRKPGGLAWLILCPTFVSLKEFAAGRATSGVSSVITATALSSSLISDHSTGSID
jgi:hypothetical protein